MPEKKTSLTLWKGLPADPEGAARGLLDAWLNGRKPTTFRTYQQGIESFAAFLKAPTREAAAQAFLGLKSGGQANQMVLAWKNWLVEQKFSTSTISVRMSALKSLAQLGRTLGLIGWTIEIKPPKVEAYRDTRGPGFEKVMAIAKSLEGRTDPKSLRDRVLLAMMGTMALRRGELVALNLEDVDLEEKRLWYLGKARSEVEPMTIPDEVCGMIRSWLTVREARTGPLFIHYGQVNAGARLTDRSVGRISNSYGLGRAHGLRHSAITEALDKNDGDVRKVAKFSRHKNVQTLLKYDDNRRDEGGEIAKGLAREL